MSELNLQESVTVGQLRADFPLWSWRVERQGFGYHYYGNLGNRTVRVHSVGEIGRFEDDVIVRWQVTEQDKTESFAMFWLHESIKKARGEG